MLGSRTVKTLTALLATMTIGALILLVMETAPIRPPSDDLAAVDARPGQAGRAVNNTEVPLQSIKWRNIILHAAPSPQSPTARQCHFVIGPDPDADGLAVEATDLWRYQQSGSHTSVAGRDYNRDSIGVCLIGEFSRSRPTQAQFDALVGLVRTLQRTCRIPADHVYLHSDVDFTSRTPGEAFPTKAFADSLLTATTR